MTSERPDRCPCPRCPCPVHRQWSLCVLVTESICKRPWEDVARVALEAGADCIQLREKDLSGRELLSRARRLRELTHEHDAALVINKLAKSAHKLIITTSFGYMHPTLKVAKRFPKVKFEHATGYKRSDNVATYNARFYEGRYIIGQIAAKMSKSGVAGYIASFPIPEVVMGINSFILGAQTVNSNFKVKVIWVNSWFDPGKEADAAKVLIGQGADIITQHTDSTAPLITLPESLETDQAAIDN